MNISIPDNCNIHGLATASGFASVDEYVFHLIERDTERIAIQEGLAAVREGRSRPFEEFDAEFRQRHNLTAEE